MSTATNKRSSSLLLAFILAIAIGYGPAPVRGQSACPVYLKNYANTTVTVSLYYELDYSPFCPAGEALVYRLLPSEPELLTYCNSEHQCSILVGVRNDTDTRTNCDFNIPCAATLIFYQDSQSNGTVQHCFSMGGTCYVPPKEGAATSSSEGARSLLRGGER